jgi:hypothetical protein
MVSQIRLPRKTGLSVQSSSFRPKRGSNGVHKLLHTLATHLHSHGVSLLPYLDDWIIRHPDPQVLLDHRTLVTQTLEKAGFLINLPKSELVPTQDIQFRGIRFKLDREIASTPSERIRRTVQLARRYSHPTDHPPSVRLNYHQVTFLMESLIGSRRLSSWDASISDLYSYYFSRQDCSIVSPRQLWWTGSA